MEGLPVMVTDTIGFIDEVSIVLIQAFYTTLKELLHSDLLLLVVDASEPLSEIVRKINASRKVLVDIGAVDIPLVLVLNKIDKLEEKQVEEIAYELKKRYPYKVVAISALKSINLGLLKREVVNELEKCSVIVSGFAKIPPKEELYEVLQKLCSKAIVRLSQRNGFVIVDFKAKKSVYPYLKAVVEKCGGEIALYDGKTVQSGSS